MGGGDGMDSIKGLKEFIKLLCAVIKPCIIQGSKCSFQFIYLSKAPNDKRS